MKALKEMTVGSLTVHLVFAYGAFTLGSVIVRAVSRALGL